jgi:hypothetical protein
MTVVYAASAPTLQCAPSESNCATTSPKSGFSGGMVKTQSKCILLTVEHLDSILV